MAPRESPESMGACHASSVQLWPLPTNCSTLSRTASEYRLEGQLCQGSPVTGAARAQRSELGVRETQRHVTQLKAVTEERDDPFSVVSGTLGWKLEGARPCATENGPSNTHRITRQVSIHRKWWVLTGSPLWEALGGDETCEGLQSGRDSTHSCLSF